MMATQSVDGAKSTAVSVVMKQVTATNAYLITSSSQVANVDNLSTIVQFPSQSNQMNFHWTKTVFHTAQAAVKDTFWTLSDSVKAVQMLYQVVKSVTIVKNVLDVQMALTSNIQPMQLLMVKMYHTALTLPSKDVKLLKHDTHMTIVMNPSVKFVIQGMWERIMEPVHHAMT